MIKRLGITVGWALVIAAVYLGGVGLAYLVEGGTSNGAIWGLGLPLGIGIILALAWLLLLVAAIARWWQWVRGVE